jgi:hypothetical protein
MWAESWSPLRGHVISHNAFGRCQKGVNRADYFANRGHTTESGLVSASSQLRVFGRASLDFIGKSASAFRPSGDWNDDDFDVLADGVVVGRIMKVIPIIGRCPWV